MHERIGKRVTWNENETRKEKITEEKIIQKWRGWIMKKDEFRNRESPKERMRNEKKIVTKTNGKMWLLSPRERKRDLKNGIRKNEWNRKCLVFCKYST